MLWTIAGFDPSGGAGVLADTQTFTSYACESVAVATAVTAQRAGRLSQVVPMTGALVSEQWARLAEIAGPPSHVKLGMLATAEIAEVVAGLLAATPPEHVVLDPVLRSSAGPALEVGSGLLEVVRERLLPQVTVVTPNAEEAGRLLGRAAPVAVSDAQSAARALQSQLRTGGTALVTGGSLAVGTRQLAICVATASEDRVIRGARAAGDPHGTGCRFSAALLAALSQGRSIPDAVRSAHRHVAQWIRRPASL